VVWVVCLLDSGCEHLVRTFTMVCVLFLFHSVVFVECL